MKTKKGIPFESVEMFLEIKSNRISRYYLTTEFKDEPGTFYYQERKDFIDSDGVINEKFLAWEKENPGRAKKFLANLPPKTKAGKTKLPKEAVGPVLSQGRSQNKKARKS